ncbi:3-isopropylmalate dehydratase small subunit [Caballeronia novacaledonica]|uniref:3-isopropylmalate dehydratase n=1 Tax=Caballeronia novacaledonica TaxID=1544861 RepID=A0AA37MSL2_9BURK|nr:3-isopropylmalate dehydratase small subunit [Caballeronia novacaledonica]GJH30061.1 3-isopropylmalate dehydratase small subunit [Caballeronia novacaledonica]
MTTHFDFLRAVAVPIAIDNVDTDQIFPSRFSSKDRADGRYGDYFLHDRRFNEFDQENKDFILNNPKYNGAKILVASKNYACGSARPGAIYSHLDYGVSVIIAESFGSVFPTVAYKSGLLTIQVEAGTAREIREALLADPGSEIQVDLKNQRITLADDRNFSFEIDHFIKKIFIEGISEISLTLKYRSKIEQFESTLPDSFPWLYGDKG